MAFPSEPHVVEDCDGFLQLYSDGTVSRSHMQFQNMIPTQQDHLVTFKDHLFLKQFNLHIRLYKPTPPQSFNNNNETLPVIMFLHGGGFCFGSRTWPHVHTCCMRLASELRVVIAAPDYRLAPEHRLPAAVDDVVEAVRWLRNRSFGGDVWLSEGVDFDRLFVVGDSSGGNIAHHLAVRFGCGSGERDPVRVRGFVLLSPFFGGVDRTRSEEGPPEKTLSLEILDRLWRLSLPIGETRDHPLANPFVPDSPNLGHVKLDPILVIIGGNELLKDRAADYATRLKELGKNIEYVEFEGMEHGFFTHDSDSEVAAEVVQILKRFLFENSN